MKFGSEVGYQEQRINSEFERAGLGFSPQLLLKVDPLYIQYLLIHPIVLVPMLYDVDLLAFNLRPRTEQSVIWLGRLTVM